MNIGALGAIWTGIGRAARNWRLWVLFYGMNFLVAAVIALPFAAVFTKDISKSLAGSDLLAGFSYRWYVEFVHANGAYFSSLLPQVILLFAIYILMEVFLAGGFYSAFSVAGVTKIGTFFSNGALKFFPLFIVTLAEVLLLFLLYKIDAVWAAAGEEAARNALTDYQVFHAELWRYIAVAAAFLLINLLSDFVRAAVAIDDDTFMSKIRRGLLFCLKHPLSSLGVYLGCTAVSAAVIAAYFRLSPDIRAVNEEAVLLEIAVGQIFILLRIFSKLIFYAGEAALYKENQIEVIQVKPEMLE